MAGLGAGAGAFEGDQERARQAAERARLHEQQRQFNASLRQRRDEAQQAAAERAQNREDTLNMSAEDRDWRQQESQRMQSNADRQFGLQARGQEFSQQRAEKQDEWTKALNEQNMARQKQEMEFARERHKELKAKADQEREMLAKRKLLAQSTIGSAYILAKNNNGRGPAALLPDLSEALQADVRAYYIIDDGTFAVDVAVKDDAGNERIVTNPFNPAAMADLISALEETGELGKGATASYRETVTDKREHAQAMERDKARYDSYLQRSDARAESGAKLGEGAKAKIKVLSWRLDEAYDKLDYANTPEERAEWQSKIDRYSAEIDAIERGVAGVRARPVQAPQIDIQALAKQIKEEVVKKYGNTPRAREEYERLMRMSMQGGR
jgi:hypothetical protein